jgi:hypothetical protein
MTNNNRLPHRPTRGPVSKYDPETCPRPAKFLASRGATQAEIAECFGISYSRFKVWLTQYPEHSKQNSKALMKTAAGTLNLMRVKQYYTGHELGNTGIACTRRS